MQKHKKNNSHSDKNQKKAVKTTPRKRLFLVVIALNIALVLINLLILYFIPKKTAEIVVLRSEILAQKLQSQSAQKIIADLKAAEEEKQRLNRSLPNKSMLVDVIELIEGLTQLVEVQSFTFEGEVPIEDSQGFLFLPLTIIIQGTMPDTMQALYRLEKSPYLFSVNHTLIESPEGISQLIKVRTLLRIYVRRPFTEN
jgi:hypothetical protein